MKYMFMAGNLVIGASSAPLVTMAITYLDENLSQAVPFDFPSLA